MNGWSLSTIQITLIASATACIATGCSRSTVKPYHGHRLPFVAVVKMDESLPPKADGGNPETPPRFHTAMEFPRQFKSALDNAETFTRVVLDESSSIPADLELEISVAGGDFGRGETVFRGAFLSTMLWLLAGHLSWFVDDQKYPDSDISVTLTARTPKAMEETPSRPRVIYTHVILMSDLKLSLWDRFGNTTHFLNIFIPPWCVDGDREAAGKSLARRALERFAERERQQIASHLAAHFLDIRSCFLFHRPKPNDLEIVVVSQKDLKMITILPHGAAKETTLGWFDTKRAEVRDQDALEEIKRELRLSKAGINTDLPLYYYTFSLDEYLSDGVHGLIKIAARLSNGTAHWTIELKDRIRRPQTNAGLQR